MIALSQTLKDEGLDQTMSKAVSRISRDDAPGHEIFLNTRLKYLKSLVCNLVTEVNELECALVANEENNLDFYMLVEQFRIDLLKLALRRTGGHQQEAARLLGIKPTTLSAMKIRYGIETGNEEVRANSTITEGKANANQTHRHELQGAQSGSLSAKEARR